MNPSKRNMTEKKMTEREFGEDVRVGVLFRHYQKCKTLMFLSRLNPAQCHYLDCNSNSYSTVVVGRVLRLGAEYALPLICQF